MYLMSRCATLQSLTVAFSGVYFLYTPCPYVQHVSYLGGTREMVKPALMAEKSRFHREAGAWLLAPPVEHFTFFFFSLCSKTIFSQLRVRVDITIPHIPSYVYCNVLFAVSLVTLEALVNLPTIYHVIESLLIACTDYLHCRREFCMHLPESVLVSGLDRLALAWNHVGCFSCCAAVMLHFCCFIITSCCYR